MLHQFPPAHIVWWDIVFAGARIEFLGSVEATDEHDAIERAAQKFKTDPNKLLAVKRSWRGLSAGLNVPTFTSPDLVKIQGLRADTNS
jgi:hypothetical protein